LFIEVEFQKVEYTNAMPVHGGWRMWMRLVDLWSISSLSDCALGAGGGAVWCCR